ncbi:MAG: YdcF family protein [Chitinophagales bacterium]
MLRKLVIALGVLLLIGALLFLFRYPLLRFTSNALIEQNTLQKADALFVLSGNSYDRGNEAARLYAEGYTPLIVCTGANPVTELKSLDMDTLESDMLVANLHRQGIADSVIVQLKQGTSTREEAQTVLAYCQRKGFKKVIVLSSLLHTARVNSVFRNDFEKAGIALIVRGAASSHFKESEWWKSEEGLIAVNNEWLKTIYYWFKY